MTNLAEPAPARHRTVDIETQPVRRRSVALERFDGILHKVLASFSGKAPAPAADPDDGKAVNGYVFGWAPLMRACGVRTGRGLFGISNDSHVSVGVAEDYFQIPPEACTFMKLKLGAHHIEEQSRGGKKRGRIVHFGGDCEPEVMAQELLRSDGHEVFIVEPLTAFKMDPGRRDQHVKFYANEAQRLAIWLTGRRWMKSVCAGRFTTATSSSARSKR
jgi:hypothetical protein